VPPGGGTVRDKRVECDPLAWRLKKQGDLAAKRQGGDRKSGRIEAEAAFLLGEVAKTPDITLVELPGKVEGTRRQRRHRDAVALLRPAAHYVQKRRRMPLSSNAAT